MKKHLLSFLMFFCLVASAFAQPSGSATTPPARSASDVLSLFSGSYANYTGTNWYPNWGQSTQYAEVYLTGDTIKRYSNLNYQGVEIFGSINVASMQYLHFDIWTDDCDSLQMSLINEGIGEQAYKVYPTISGWKSVDIALSNYNAVALNNVGQLKIEGVSGSTIYLDNIYFWKAANAPSLSNFTVPAKTLGDASFTLTAPTSNSSGAFSYSSSNTSVATVSGNTVTIVGVGVTTITATQAASGAYGSGSISASFTVELGTAAPTPPARSSSNVISLFSNAYTNVTVDTWSAVWDQADVEDKTIAGNATKNIPIL